MRLSVAALFSALLLWGPLSTATQARELVTFAASEPYAGDQVLLRAELYRPAGPGPFPAVVLMHGCGGWQPAVRFSLQTHARFLRDNGFVVLNLDSFGPRRATGGKLCADNRALYRALSYRTQDAFDALHFLQARDDVETSQVFLMGQSNGGAVAIRVAKAASARRYSEGPTFRGVVAYYPWCGEFGGSRVTLGSPLLIFAGGRDDWVPADECQGVRSSGAALQVKIYPEAAHSFDLDILPHRYLGNLVGGHPQATEDSRARMLDFFAEGALSTPVQPPKQPSGPPLVAENLPQRFHR